MHRRRRQAAAEPVKPTLTGPRIWRWHDSEWRDRHWRRLDWRNRMNAIAQALPNTRLKIVSTCLK